MASFYGFCWVLVAKSSGRLPRVFGESAAYWSFDCLVLSQACLLFSLHS